jgi:hypothetical protein
MMERKIMIVTRRRFLSSGTVTIFLTGLALNAVPLAFARQLQKSDPSEDFKVPFEVQREPNFYYRRGTFQPYLNGVFTLRAGANSVEATLVSVTECSPSPRSSKVTRKWRPTDCFTLVFRSEGELADLTSIYDVEHGALGRFPLFLTRRDGPRGTFFYEAVFNHAR